MKFFSEILDQKGLISFSIHLLFIQSEFKMYNALEKKNWINNSRGSHRLNGFSAWVSRSTYFGHTDFWDQDS